LIEVLRAIQLPSERSLRFKIRMNPALRRIPEPAEPIKDHAFALQRKSITLPSNRIRDLAERLDERLKLLGIDIPLRITVTAGTELNAFSGLNPIDDGLILGLSGALLAVFEPEELLFVVGHELAHHYLNHTRDDAHLRRLRDLLPETASMRLKIFSLSRRAELSCDRFGLLCCGDLEAAVSALLKLIVQGNLDRLEISPEYLTGKYESPVYHFYDARIDGVRPWTETHPFPEVRARALAGFFPAMEPILGKGGPSTAITRANRVAETLLDSMEIDSLKQNQSLVREFYRSLLILGEHVAKADRKVHRQEKVVLESIRRRLQIFSSRDSSTPSEDPVESATRFLSIAASPGRRIRIMHILMSIAIQDLELHLDEHDALCDIASAIRVPNKQLERWLHSARRISRADAESQMGY